MIPGDDKAHLDTFGQLFRYIVFFRQTYVLCYEVAILGNLLSFGSVRLRIPARMAPYDLRHGLVTLKFLDDITKPQKGYAERTSGGQNKLLC